MDSRLRFRPTYLLLALLLAAFSTLAILQYRWISAVSVAERQRMQTNVELATKRFAEEFNGEIARAVIAARTRTIDVAAVEGGLFFQWTATSAFPDIVKDVYVIESAADGISHIVRFNGRSKALEPCSWPSHLLPLKEELSAQLAREPFTVLRREMRFIPLEQPAVLAPVFTRIRAPELPQAGIRTVSVPPPEPPDWAVIEFNQDYIVDQVLPALVQRYFATLENGEFRVVVRARDAARTVLYRSDSTADATTAATADSSAGLLEIPPALPALTALPALPGEPGRFIGRSSRDLFIRPLEPPPMPQTYWELQAEHRLGSLDAAASRVRRRNLAVSAGILLILVTAIVMIIVASERERVLARLQMQFAAAVSHELRTPLAAIQTLTHNLSAGIVRNPGDVRDYARMVRDEVHGLSNIVDQVLLLAETRSLRRRYDVAAVDVIDMLDQALSSLNSQLDSSHYRIVTDIPDDLPAVRANAVALAHCLRNLVSNAMKYGLDHQRRIDIVAATAGNEVEIRVIDHGAGISAEDRLHLFEPFFRGQSARPGVRGAGLGLYLVKRMMEAQGGKISVESEIGDGSKFVLHIPVFIQDRNAPAPAAR